jgi:hypothetical protein
MRFEPKNRHLLVEIIEEEEQKKAVGAIEIYYPEGYEAPKSPYVVCKILDIAPSCSVEGIGIEDQVLIERRMLNKLEIRGETFYLVLENYIYGRII